MKKFACGLVALVLAVGCGGEAKKDDKKPEDTTTKARGQLPAHFKKLGLRDDQIQKVYRVRAEYKTKTEELKKQIDRLKTEEKDALEKILTPEQLKRLKELRTGDK